MIIRLKSGKSLEKSKAVEVKGEWVAKDSCLKCSSCQDYYIEEKDDTGRVHKKNPRLLGGTYCCGACVVDAGIVINRFGDYIRDQKIGQYNFFQYRNGTRIHKTTHKDPYLIGFEIEKEDNKYYKKLKDRGEGLHMPKGWICMADSSLKTPNGGGFELISPAYNLTKDFDTIKTALKEYSSLIGSNYSRYCGGHISISKKGYTGSQLAMEQKPLICFFLTLFPARMRNINIHQYTFKECLRLERKHKPFHSENNGRFELRMISAVKSSRQLMRRIKTIEWFLIQEPTFIKVFEEMKNKNGILRKLYRPVYGSERWAEFIKRFSKMSLWFCKGVNASDIANLVNRDELD